MVRALKGVPHWLIQPCHVLSFLLIYVLLNTKNDARHFYYYFYSIWMPTVGLLSPPHASWFKWWWEPTLFYVHHAMLLLIPYYYLFFNHRFHSHFISSKTTSGPHYLVSSFQSLKKRVRYFIQVYASGLLYHSLVLGFASLYFEEDFDAMRCRFDGGEIFGNYWREFMIICAVILAMIVCKIPDIIAHAYQYRKLSTKSLKSQE
ncbi:hypothetical protein DLAC_06254 [Tieghemostelium lacteum]|uniref:Transmembrane protein n=1 Tax=Tieghemostelium lacteum TaxID=361077 RepID=A0A151ZHS5_TIELA|nr:hypothetical protein DLAC_06254 [Tieghemostelium lacteum]|eukprot:KYQ93548.1 hypothetical protein DLAC_06254 [Tieghemostelium lacteum]